MSEFTDRLVNVTQHALTDSGYMSYVSDAEKAAVALLRELQRTADLEESWFSGETLGLLADEIEAL